MSKPKKNTNAGKKIARTAEYILDRAANATSKDGLLQKASKAIDLRKEYKADMAALTNHPEWYDKYPLIQANANYSYPRGEYFKHGLNTTTAATRIPVSLCEPFEVTSVKDTGQLTWTVATNTAYISAFQLLYADIRATNSGAINYTPNQLRSYLHNVRGVYALYWFANRSLAAIKHMNVYEKSSPQAVLGTCGLTPTQASEIRDNLANYINALNLIAHKINSLCPVPPNMSILQREKFLFSQIFQDRKSLKCCYFGYTPHRITYFASGAESDSNYASSETTVCAQNGALEGTFSDFLGALGDLVNKITTDAHWSTVVGDILKCFGSKAYLSLPTVDYNSLSLPILFDEYALDQYKNTVSYTTISNKTGCFIAYSTVSESEVVPATDTVIEVPCIINSPSDDTSRGKTLSLTRNTSPMFLISGVESDKVHMIARFSDGHSFRGFTVYYFSNSSTIDNFSQTTWNNNSNNAQMLIQSGCSPMMVYMGTRSTPVQGIENWAFSYAVDLNTYAILDATNFKPFSDSAILSLWKADKMPVKTTFRLEGYKKEK